MLQSEQTAIYKVVIAEVVSLGPAIGPYRADVQAVVGDPNGRIVGTTGDLQRRRWVHRGVHDQPRRVDPGLAPAPGKIDVGRGSALDVVEQALSRSNRLGRSDELALLRVVQQDATSSP